MESLITKLGDSVNNSSLPVYKWIVIPSNGIGSGKVFKVGTAADASDTNLIIFSKDSYVRLSGTTFTDGKTEKLIDSTGATVTASQNSIEISFKNIFGLLALHFTSAMVVNLSLNDLKFAENLKVLRANGASGDVANLPNITFSNIKLGNSANPSLIYGDFAEIARRITDTYGNSTIGEDGNGRFEDSAICGDLSLTPKNIKGMILGRPATPVWNTWTAGRRVGNGNWIMGCGGDSYYGFKTITMAENFLIDNSQCSFANRSGAKNMIIKTENNDSYTPSQAVLNAVATLKSLGMTTISINDYVFS